MPTILDQQRKSLMMVLDANTLSWVAYTGPSAAGAVDTANNALHAFGKT